MTVANTPARAVTVAAPGATVFPFGFKVVDPTHLLVTVGGVTKGLNVDYTVTGVGADLGGTATFLAPMVGGETVVLRRSMPYSRETDYQVDGDLHADTLNDDQDAPVMMLQQLAAEVARGLHLADVDTDLGRTQLPPLQPGKPLVGAADGRGLVFGDTTLTGDMALRGSLADGSPGSGAALVAFTLPAIGAEARTLAAWLQERVSILNFIPVAQHAAIAARTSTYDCAQDIRDAIAYVGGLGGGEIDFPAGLYMIGSTVECTYSNVKLRGRGRGGFRQGHPNVRLSAATLIQWIAGAAVTASVLTAGRTTTYGTPMFRFTTLASQQRNCGGGLRDLMIDGNAVCPVGVHFLTWSGMECENVAVVYNTEDNWLFGNVDYAVAVGPCDTQSGNFVRCLGINSGGSGWYLTNTARSWRLTGGKAGSTGDCSAHMFTFCDAVTAKGDPWTLEFAGQNIFMNCDGAALFGNASGAGFILCSSDQDTAHGTEVPRYNQWLGCETAALLKASQLVSGTAGWGNTFIGMSTGNNAVPVTYETPTNNVSYPEALVLSTAAANPTSTPSKIRSNQFKAVMHDAGPSTAGPLVYLSRENPGSTASKLGEFRWLMRDSANAPDRSAGRLASFCDFATPAAEYATLQFYPMVNGDDTQLALGVRNGLIVPDGLTNVTPRGFGTVSASVSYWVGASQVVGARQTGWTAASGTANKAAYATYAGATHSASYVQATVQALDNAARDASQRIKAIEDALRAHGLIN